MPFLQAFVLALRLKLVRVVSNRVGVNPKPLRALSQARVTAQDPAEEEDNPAPLRALPLARVVLDPLRLRAHHPK